LFLFYRLWHVYVNNSWVEDLVNLRKIHFQVL
jgi:hypothetical protein